MGAVDVLGLQLWGLELDDLYGPFQPKPLQDDGLEDGRIQTQMSSNGPGKTEERRSFLGVGVLGWTLLLTCFWEAGGNLSGL